jgi:hypothetical protein
MTWRHHHVVQSQQFIYSYFSSVLLVRAKKWRWGTMSKSKSIWMSIWLLALIMLASGCTKCVKFNTVPTGTEWGTPAGHSSGDVVHTEKGIKVSVQDFYWSATQTTFRKTKADTSFMSSSEKAINTNNINLEFDFTDLFFSPDKVVVIFRDTGGIENISVNGSSVLIGELASGSTSGVTWTVADSPEPNNPHNRVGTLTIDGDVEKLKIGGQEFWIDSVCAELP